MRAHVTAPLGQDGAVRFALFLSMLWLTACPLVEPAPVPPPKETGCLRVHPLAIDFGEVATFTNGFATARVNNESDQTQTLRALPLSPPFVVTPTDQFVVVRSGESATFQVRFEPGDSLLHLDELEVSSPRCSVKVPVQGLGEGVLEVTPLLLDFGMLDLRQSKTLEVQFLNTRRVPDSLVFSPLPGDTFTLSAPTLVVPAVGSASLLVTARPTGPFLYEAALQIESVLGDLTARAPKVRQQ